MKEAGNRPNHLRLIHGKGRPRGLHPESLRVTDEELRAKAARAALHLVEDSEKGDGTDGEHKKLIPDHQL